MGSYVNGTEKQGGVRMKRRVKGLGIIIYIALYLSLFVMGVISGMILQQRLIALEVQDVLMGSNIEVNVDINETKIVEETGKMFNNTILPRVLEAQKSKGDLK